MYARAERERLCQSSKLFQRIFNCGHCQLDPISELHGLRDILVERRLPPTVQSQSVTSAVDPLPIGV